MLKQGNYGVGYIVLGNSGNSLLCNQFHHDRRFERTCLAPGLPIRMAASQARFAFIMGIMIPYGANAEVLQPTDQMALICIWVCNAGNTMVAKKKRDDEIIRLGAISNDRW